ncbi:glycosyltransferase family 4 protein [Patescibacteria group bacterium]|nr:glycosyltransferase family 4 protein [Patescibacteria group bacterium]
MNILLLSRYGRLGASSRLRFYQYLPFLKLRGIEVTVAPLFGDDYVKGLYSGKVPIVSVLRSYITRLRVMLRVKRFDVVWLEKEMLPWLPGWLEFGLFPGGISLVVDYDDAVFHRYDQHQFSWVRALLGGKIDTVMRQADLVIVGNDYLGDRARQAGARQVEFLPTVVDVTRYAVVASALGGPVIIGWIGSPSTAKNLHLVAPVLQEIANSRGARVVAVGANTDQLYGLPIEVRPWSEQSEVSDIQQFDIGIMPLSDKPFERGKCGYKLIQYMACGKPVVASPVGANRVIIRKGVDGFLPGDLSQWGEVLRDLCDDPSLRKRLGTAGRKSVETQYSLQVTAPRLEELLRLVKTI